MALSGFRFESLPRPAQVGIFAGVVACMSFVFYLHYLKDKIAENETIQADIARLELSVAQMAAVEARLKRFRLELEDLEKRLAELQSILPAEKETPAVLRNVYKMAVASDLKINKFTPQPVVPRAFYADWPIQIEVEGSYDGLGVFFEKISQSTRIIDVGTISVQGLDKDAKPGRTLSASCTATTFVFTENDEQGVKSNARR